MLCKICHYPLKQLSEPRCPECGRGFDPNDPSTFDIPQRGKKTFWVRLLVITGLTYLATFVLIVGVGIARTPGLGQLLPPSSMGAGAKPPVLLLFRDAAGVALLAAMLVFAGVAFLYWVGGYVISRVRMRFKP